MGRPPEGACDECADRRGEDARQDLRHRRGQGARSEGRRSRHQSRGDGLDHGALGLWQDDAAQLPFRPGRDRRRRRPDRRRLTRCDVRPRAHRLPRRPHGFRVPVLQPDARAHGRGERRAPAPRLPRAGKGGTREGARRARAGRVARSRQLTCRTSCPAASASGRPSHARSSTIPRSCGPTSRPAISTARTRRRSRTSCAT